MKSTSGNFVNGGKSHAATFSKVLDGRKRPVRGLWKRNDRFYAQLAITDAATGKKSIRRVPLVDKETNQPVATVPQAIAALDRLKVKRTDGDRLYCGGAPSSTNTPATILPPQPITKQARSRKKQAH